MAAGKPSKFSSIPLVSALWLHAESRCAPRIPQPLGSRLRGKLDHAVFGMLHQSASPLRPRATVVKEAPCWGVFEVDGDSLVRASGTTLRPNLIIIIIIYYGDLSRPSGYALPGECA